MSSLKDRFNSFFAMEDDVDYDDVQESSKQTVNTQSQAPIQQNRVKAVTTQTKTTNPDNLYALPKNSSAQVSVIEPRFYSEVEGVGELLLNHHIVVLNLHRAESKQAVRMIDFLNGVVFSIKGEIKRVGENIFVCTPPNVTLDDGIEKLTTPTND